jgi:hemolysin III
LSKSSRVKYYSPQEERLNILTHGLGLLLSMAALPLLVVRAVQYGDAWHIVSCSVYGSTLIILYGASTLYHSSTKDKWRRRFNILDHAAIFVLIAGTYTPFVLVTLNGAVGWTIFGVIWGIAVAGVILKLFYTGRFDRESTILYVAMGWIIIVVFKPLIDNFPMGGLLWLLAGGVSYTLGALLYRYKHIRFNHAIFHVFVLIGSACHFVAVYWYVVPG